MQISSTEILDLIHTSIVTWSELSDRLQHKSASDTAYYAGAIAALNQLSLEVSRRAQERNAK